MTKYLLEANVVLALLQSGHVHSVAAGDWLGTVSAPECLGICRVVEMATLRLLTRRAVMGDALLSASEAWTTLDTLLMDDRFELAAETANLRETWESVCDSIPKGACAETDSYLAAFAIASRRTFVTFDKGKSRFSGLQVQELS